MRALAIHTPDVTGHLPSGVRGVVHQLGQLPTRDALAAALPVAADGTRQTALDVLWIGGDHGDVDASGLPRQLNGCSDITRIKQFFGDLTGLGITTHGFIVDSCFSVAILPELAPLLAADGIFAGWSGICPVKRHELIATQPLRGLVEQTEDNLVDFHPGIPGSSQVVYGKAGAGLLRYAGQVARASMAVIGDKQSDIADAEATIARIVVLGAPLIGNAADPGAADRDAFIARLQAM